MREAPEPVEVEVQNIERWHTRSSEIGYHLYFGDIKIGDLFGSYYRIRHIAMKLNESLPEGLPRG